MRYPTKFLWYSFKTFTEIKLIDHVKSKLNLYVGPFRGLAIEAGIIALVNIYFILKSKTRQFPQSHREYQNRP